MLDFGSRSHAEAYTCRLSAVDGSLRIQAVPKNDLRDVDAYLSADHKPSITEPAEIDGDGKTWMFNVGPNLYGALEEAMLSIRVRIDDFSEPYSRQILEVEPPE